MLWVTWRQQRTQVLVTGALVLLAAVALAVTGLHLASLYQPVSSCHVDCDLVAQTFGNEAQSGFSGVIYHLSLYGMYVMPALVGVFWGAPLVARELETGTHRLAWNQSVSRTRWLVTKLAVGGVLAILTAGILSVAASLATHHLEHASRIGPDLFGARGVVPVAYAAFAFALGVATGAILRRTVPAMAVTLAIYVVATVLMPTVVRAHLLPTRSASAPLTADSRFGLRLAPGGNIQILGTMTVPDSWTLSAVTVKPGGTAFSGPVDPSVCGPDSSPKGCIRWLGSLHLRQVVTYQPGSHFWPLQWAEGGLFLILTVLLAAVAMWRIRRLS